MTTTTAEPASRLRCPHCGAQLAPDQDWCLECGAAATTRILRPPSWKLAAAIVLGVVAVVVVAVVIVVNALSGDSRRAVASRAPRAAPAARVATPKHPVTPATPRATTAPAAAKLAAWPSGRQAWTVVLATAPSRAAAQRRARALAAKGVKAGVLDTAKFDLADPGAAFVVFTGQFRDQAAAVAGESRLAHRAPASAFVAEVSPR